MKNIDNKKKILFVASVAGHINVFHIPYIELLRKQGYEVHIAAKRANTVEIADEKHEICFERFPLKTKNLKAFKDLKELINSQNYSIIHCHTPVAGVLTRLAARKARKKGTKVLYTAHGFHFYKGAPLINWLVYYPIEKFMAKYTDCIITITQEDYELAKKKFKKAKQIEHINGIGMNKERFDIQISNDQKKNLQKELQIENDEIVLSYVAELNNNKNQKLLINATEKLIKKENKIKLLLIGNGPLKEEYEKLVKEKGVEKNVLLLGIRKDVPELLSITDIYVASSIREGLPVNIMEAMYLEKPIIATENRGHNELVINNENGYIISLNNIDKFVEKLLYLINNEDKRIQMGKKGKYIVKPYTIENVIIQMDEIYKAVGGI